MNFKQKSAIFITLPCLFVFGALPLHATDLSAVPTATARILTPLGHDAQLTKFAQTSRRIDQLDSPMAKARLEAELARYQAFMDHGLPLLEAMSAGILNSGQEAELRNFIATLEGPEPPIIGSTTLPYQNLAAAQRLPLEEPNITPAYKGGNQTPQPADRQASPTAPLSQAIVNKARELNWNPVNIFDYVYNYVGTEWYHGSMKGAEQTLLQGSGNDSDQAALLVALLRASGYPARFVVGVGRLLDLDRAPLVFGVENTQQVLQLLRRAGIPHAQELSAGKLSNIRFEHVWVAAYLPFTDYRGSAMEEGGELWTSMNTSLKAAGYELNEPPSLPESLDLTSISENYLQADRPETPLEFLKAEIEVLLDATQADHTYEDLLQTREQKPQHQDILPSSLPFLTALVTSESTSLPERLLHQVKFTAYDAVNPSQVFFELTLPGHKLSNRSIALRYEPETVEDQEIINSFGGLGATPAYLVRLRPVLTVAGQRLAIGTAGLPMGADARLSIELAGPAGTKRFVNELVVGNLTVMALVAGRPILAEPLALEQKGAERIYFDEALMYLLRWQAAERELASLLRLHLLHPAPQVVTLGGVVQVNQVLGVPHEFTWKGAFVDADLRQVELVGVPINRVRFMELSGLQGSVLEDRILREDLGVDSISTARLLAIANNQGIPLLTIDSSNIDTLLPSLPFGAKVKQDIRDAVQQGQQVLVPDRMLTVGVWTGVGYMRTDPLTGEAGWMLSGLIAGATFVVGFDDLPEYLRNVLSNAMSEPPSDDPDSVAYLYPVPSEPTHGTVGVPLDIRLRAVDAMGVPVKNAEILFQVSQGGGEFFETDRAVTDEAGIATLSFLPGTNTYASPYFVEPEGEAETQQVGLNTIRCSAANGVRSQLPIQVLAFPDMNSVQLSVDVLFNRYMSNDVTAAFVAQAKDQYGNPVSNEEVSFTFYDPEPVDLSEYWCPIDYAEVLLPQLVVNNDPCLQGVLDRQSCQPVVQPSLTGVDGLEFLVVNGSCTCADYQLDIASAHGNDELHFQTPCIFLEGPWHLVMQFEDSMDAAGRPVRAVPANETVHLEATVYAQSGVRFETEEAVLCSSGSTTCQKTSYDWSFSVNRYDFENPTQILFNGVPATQDEDHPWKFSNDFMVAPGLNEVQVSGYATVVEEGFVPGGACDASGSPYCRSDRPDVPYTIGDDPAYLGLYRSVFLYGIEVAYDKPHYVAYIGDYGIVLHDLEIGMVLAPTAYVPEGATFILYEQYAENNEPVPVDDLPLAAFSPDRQIDINEDGIPDANVFAITIPAGKSFNPKSRYFFDFVFYQATEYEFHSARWEIEMRSIKLDITAYSPGTIDEPGKQLSNYAEDNPEELVMYVNSDRNPSTGERDFSDEVIYPLDSDIVKLVLRKVDEDSVPDGIISLSIEPQELFKVYDRELQPVPVTALFDLSTAPEPNLDIKSEDVTLYIESLGPVYCGKAILGLSDPLGSLVTSDRIQLTAIFHTEDYHEAVLAHSIEAMDSACVDFDHCKSIWSSPETGYTLSECKDSPYWENTPLQFPNLSNAISALSLVEGVSPSSAFIDIFENPERYSFECANAIKVIQLRAVLSLLERCNNPGDYLCRFKRDAASASPSQPPGDQLFNKAFSGKTLALAGSLTEDNPDRFADLKFKYTHQEYRRPGSWTYLRNPSEFLRRNNIIIQGQNLINLSAEGCVSCSVNPFVFAGVQYCKYSPELLSDTASRCIRDKHFFGHQNGKMTMQEWVDLFSHYTDTWNTLNPKNAIDKIDGKYLFGVSSPELEVDFVSLLKTLSKTDWSEE